MKREKMINDNGYRVVIGEFSGETMDAAEEREIITNAIYNGEERIYMDNEGVFRVGNLAENMEENGTEVVLGTFNR